MEKVKIEIKNFLGRVFGNRVPPVTKIEGYTVFIIGPDGNEYLWDISNLSVRASRYGKSENLDMDLVDKKLTDVALYRAMESIKDREIMANLLDTFKMILEKIDAGEEVISNGDEL